MMTHSRARFILQDLDLLLYDCKFMLCRIFVRFVCGALSSADDIYAQGEGNYKLENLKRLAWQSYKICDKKCGWLLFMVHSQ